MKNILKNMDVSGEQSGAGTGSWLKCGGELLESISPINGEVIGRVRCADRDNYERVVSLAAEAFLEWRNTPAPKRGDIVRQIGNAIRTKKKDLGSLVSLEVGKIQTEGDGEVQEMIDIADFALGQSRMLYGTTMHSERPNHRMYEQWHPLGPTGVITTFNFPVAVWSWNAMIALIAGNTVIWKPSSITPISAIATMKIVWSILKENNLPEGILNLLIGRREDVSEPLIKDHRVPLISATGSVTMGLNVSRAVAARLGKTILELGGNNGVIVTPKADIGLAVQAVVFGALGTSGQRCTTIRRVIVHKDIYKVFTMALIEAYNRIQIGNPFEKGVLMGPLINHNAVKSMQAALRKLKEQDGRVIYGGEALSGGIYDTETYVRPCICEAMSNSPIVHEETFAPILYLIQYETLDEAIQYNNEVPQGLSSAIFTNDLKEAERFLSHVGSDCGIANVNTGPSGAEIGGAFGGEKNTGGGREAGSDVWKTYMRRQTCTINWSNDIPLAQGICFDID